MNHKGVTLELIADKAHVSKSLVSRVLNNRPVRVSDQKREQILKIANELDYIPSGQLLSASPLPRLTKTIALLLPNFNSQFMSIISETITQKAYENGYSVIIFDSKENNSLTLKYLELCHTLNVSGIILDSFSNADNTKYLDKLNSWGIPFLFLDCYPAKTEYTTISSQNKEGMFRLTESLIARGHKKILSIIQANSSLTSVSLERLDGYYEAMDKYGLSGTNEIIYPNRDYCQQPIFSLLNSSVEFTAFIIHTGSDVRHFCELLPVTRYGNDHNFEIGVFDDFHIPFLEYASGTNRFVYEKIVSVVSQRPREMASIAMDTLIEQIKKGAGIKPTRIFIDCDLTMIHS